MTRAWTQGAALACAMFALVLGVSLVAEARLAGQACDAIARDHVEGK